MFVTTLKWRSHISVKLVRTQFQDSTTVGLNLTIWDVAKVESFSYMFSQWTGQKTQALGLEEWNMSSALAMDGMFSYSVSDSSIDFSRWNVKNVHDMYAMVRIGSKWLVRSHFLVSIVLRSQERHWVWI